MTSPLLPYIDYMLAGLILYAGVVGLLLTLVPEGTKLHSFVQRVLMPSALTISAFFAALIVCAGLVGGWILAREIMR